MIKQSVPVVAIAVILSACASMEVPPAQSVAVDQTVTTTAIQASATSDPAAPQVTVIRVFWFFGDR
jgi:PBP1b-binding outer membrane lipoprotein LpoB